MRICSTWYGGSWPEAERRVLKMGRKIKVIYRTAQGNKSRRIVNSGFPGWVPVRQNVVAAQKKTALSVASTESGIKSRII